MEITNRLQRQTFSTPITSHDLPNPSVRYFDGSIEDYLKFVVPLYEASITGDWETAKLIFEKRPDLIRIGLNKYLETALHVAVAAQENMMTREELELRNIFSNTAFWKASNSQVGNLNMIKVMLEKNPSLSSIRGNNRHLPLSINSEGGTHNTVKYLYDKSHKMTGDHWGDEDKNRVLINCLKNEFFDVALQIVKDHPDVLAAKYADILGILARKTVAFNKVEEKKLLTTRVVEQICRFFHVKVEPAAGGEEDTDTVKLLKIVWGDVIKTMNIDEIEHMLKAAGSSRGTLFVAAEAGNTRFIAEIFRTYPNLMFLTNRDNLTVFHIAVMHRHQGIYNLLYETGVGVRHDICTRMDYDYNNMLHLVGKTSKEMAAKTSGASLLMQRELLWFKVAYILTW